MPLPKRQALPTQAKGKDESRRTRDPRFASFETDSKYRLPSKKHTKTKLDSRFSRLLTDPDFYNKSTVDKYGRKVDKDAGKKNIEKFYRIDESEDEEDEDEEEPEKARKRDSAVKKQLKKVELRGKNYDPIRDGGLSSSSDESSSDEEEEEEEEVIEEQAELPEEEDNAVPMGDVTARLAAVNMDWDNMRASDIMAVANSFVPADGKILSVVIYPSEFGRERLQREDIEGPPRAIFASTSAPNDLTTLDDEPEVVDSEDEEQIKKDLLKEGTGEEFDSKALREYQLDRLRYYYAIITCASPSDAKSVYDHMDGREYLSSANFFDLRFVPDETTFDEEPHDECEILPEGYKPNEFTTDALQHSKVKLTWDADDNTRKEAQKRAFSRKEIDENELKAYLGSDSEDDETEGQPDKAAALRAALGLEEGLTSKPKSGSKRDRDFKKPEGEMQVTFSAGLSTNAPKGSVFENEPIVDETTLEKFVRKQKERKQKRKERAKAIKEGRDPDLKQETPEAGDGDEDDPWNDPFFAADPEEAKPVKSDMKAQRAKKRAEKEKEEAAEAAERANLELLMVDDDEGGKVRHFNMNEIAKAEKAKKKGKKKSKDQTVAVEDDFKLDTTDPRFAKLYESHEFAIDPTNPRYKGTSGMKALLEEGRKKRKHHRDDEGEEARPKKKKEKGSGDADDLKKLAARVKAKSKV